MKLVIEQLRIQYGSIIAIDDISCAASRGKVTVVVGPNAVGKSTLLRACIGAVRPATGRVVLEGRAVHEWRAAALASRLAYVPQQSTVAGGFTVREVVELGRYALPPDRSHIDRAMGTMEVRELAERSFNHLSHGQQQRVTLARALAQSSDDGILILDEPMSGMDLDHMLRSMRLLRRLAEGGATILLAVHDLDAAAHFADDAWLLQGGRLALAGPAREVLKPGRLTETFGVRFDEVVTGSGELHLVPVFDP